ncbi:MULTISPECIES: HAD family hydrolase [Ramlibacter]|uniref:phosphoglycolate phosphatase n=1 Tax=Ramlibacter pinisoli TaxID=2682844 RepID=A0A6N8IXH1_9BURK|nr:MULTISPECIES: HAD family hydrolase [Ramlibacter]MBA2961398.1 HAD family hydrolase [Ramlibacter sp. CGMCC 1.13660]MVQ31342.1 HAD-IA family hydrolase [Ramlibacter pinisoli]
MALDLTRVRALCFDVDGTIADTDDHLVARLATLLDVLPGVSGRRAERTARQLVMAAETPVHAAYARLDALGLDVPVSRLRARLKAIRQRGADPAHTRNPEAIDELPHDMVPGVQEMLVTLARDFPMCTISTGAVPRIERFLQHYGVRGHFTAVVGAETTRRMKPHPEPLRYAAAAMGVEPQHCLMVGDTTIDIRTAVAAGAQSVGVLCGFGTERELRVTGAQLILRTTSDLLAVLRPAEDPLQKTASPEPKI